MDPHSSNPGCSRVSWPCNLVHVQPTSRQMVLQTLKFEFHVLFMCHELFNCIMNPMYISPSFNIYQYFPNPVSPPPLPLPILSPGIGQPYSLPIEGVCSIYTVSSLENSKDHPVHVTEISVVKGEFSRRILHDHAPHPIGRKRDG